LGKPVKKLRKGPYLCGIRRNLKADFRPLEIYNFTRTASPVDTLDNYRYAPRNKGERKRNLESGLTCVPVTKAGQTPDHLYLIANDRVRTASPIDLQAF
jgi:hypothetical protein